MSNLRYWQTQAELFRLVNETQLAYRLAALAGRAGEDDPGCAGVCQMETGGS